MLLLQPSEPYSEVKNRKLADRTSRFFTGIINILYSCVCLEMTSIFGLTSVAFLQVLEIHTVM